MALARSLANSLSGSMSSVTRLFGYLTYLVRMIPTLT